MKITLALNYRDIFKPIIPESFLQQLNKQLQLLLFVDRILLDDCLLTLFLLLLRIGHEMPF